jgi:pyruvate-formate lyase-activating enzyme
MPAPPLLLTSTRRGRITEDRQHAALGRSGHKVRPPRADEWSPMPEGTVLHFLPDRVPRARALKGGQLVTVHTRGKEKHPVLAVAAMLPNGWARTLLPAYESTANPAVLPFYGYTAVGFDVSKDQMVVAAVQTEDSYRWSPFQYDTPDLAKTVKQRLVEQPDNRLLAHHARCALEYHCYNAQNLFYRRWEGAIAVAAACNARCHGCISLQPEDMPPSPQERLDFVPTISEIVELGLPHLDSGDAILSFGQGCEGEPLLKAPLIAEAIRALRQATARGTIHINTNGSSPEGVGRLIESGLDSVRVSLNSVTPERYEAYYRPANYRFAEVEETVRMCRAAGLQVTLNLLFFPGVNDLPEELEALEAFVTRHRIDQIQMRNLNIDPDYYLSTQPPLPTSGIGIPRMIERLRALCRIGNSTPSIRA